MAAGDLANLNGVTKRVYGRLHNAVPKLGWLTRQVPWSKAETVGDRWEELIVLSNEQGFTAGGTSGSFYALNGAVDMSTSPAYVTPNEFTLELRMSYGRIRRAMKRGLKAFAKSVALVIANGMDSFANRHEIQYHHGQSATGLAEFTVDSYTNTDSTTTVMTVPDAQWAPGIWAGQQNALLEFRDESGDAVGSGDFTLSYVDMLNSKLTVTASSSDITALEAKNNSGSGNEKVRVYFKGYYSNDMIGIDKIFSNSSSSLFGIDASAEGQWQGNTFSAGSAAATFELLNGVAAALNARGLTQNIWVECSPFTWADLNSEQAAQRVQDESYNKRMGEMGVKQLRYHTQSGYMTVAANPVCKASRAYVFPSGVLKRIGSSDREWNLPGQQGGDVWSNVQGYNGCETRMYSDHAIFCRDPKSCAVITDITNDHTPTG